jgi:hypothetical protein
MKAKDHYFCLALLFEYSRFNRENAIETRPSRHHPVRVDEYLS